MKKRTNILHITLVFGASLALSSCKNDGFLDRFPKSEFSEPTYFKTENDLKLYANTFYNNLPQVNDYRSDDNSDNMLPSTSNPLLTGTYAIPASGGGWDAGAWLNIRRCNYFLKRYENAQTNNQALYAAEVRFFRALFYWQKVKDFGDVPLVLTDLDDTSAELYGPRVNRNLVMDQVITDLEFAVQNLPNKGSEETGRLNKDNANALLSRIALWEGTFRKYHNLGDGNPILQKSLAASEALINSGKYKLYTTGNPDKDYFNLFVQQDLKTNPETIMHWAYIIGTTTQNYTRQSGESNTGATKDLADSYLFKDGKPIGLTSYTYDDSSPTNEVKNRDPRYVQTIATPGFVYSTNPVLTYGLPNIGTSQTSSGYWLIKGRSSDPTQMVANQSDVDAFIFRYAEILLNFAEAKYELGGTISQADLDKSINLLRSRVGMPALSTAVQADPNAINYGYTVAPLLYEIRRERRVELMGEGFRFNDIKRWKAGKLVEGIKTVRGMKLNTNLRSQYSYDVSKIATDNNALIIVNTNFTNGRQWNDKYYYLPLPLDQITLTQGKPGAYSQNPGWQ
ncbi:MAG: RagB/SusD family nutrient uptake outer membrane protein [Sphingobacterium sp.]